MVFVGSPRSGRWPRPSDWTSPVTGRLRGTSRPTEDAGVEAELTESVATASTAAAIIPESAAPAASTTDSNIASPPASWSSSPAELHRRHKRSRVSNALPFRCRGRYVMVDSTTAGAARRPSVIL
jgi:hypothetical protein